MQINRIIVFFLYNNRRQLCNKNKEACGCELTMKLHDFKNFTNTSDFASQTHLKAADGRLK